MIKIFAYLKNYKWLAILTIALVVFESFVTLYLPDLMSKIVDRGIVTGNVKYIWQVGGKMLLFSGLGIAAMILASYTSATVSTGVGKDLREDLFRKVQSFSLAEMDKFSTASLITRTTNDVAQIQQVVFMMLRMVIRAPTLAIGGVVMALNKSPSLTKVLLITVPLTLGVFYVIYKIAVPMFQKLQEKIDKLSLIIRERVTGVRVIRAFDRDEYEKERFEKANVDLTNTSLKINRLMAFSFPLINIIMNFTIVAIIWFGAKQIDLGKLQVGSMMAVIQYVMQIMFALIFISSIFIFMSRASVSAKRIFEVLETEPSILDPKDQIVPEIKGVIEFENVSFTYPGAREPVLKNISFKAEPGKITAIIGSTGSGKTTILNLIMRFYNITEGSIKLDGVDIRKIPLNVLRSSIGYAPQRPIIFATTIAENIRFGRNITDEDLLEAADTAKVLEFASKMPEGLNTEIAQGGTNISGGQKQRISIARAIVSKPKIYLFDDTFSALDFKTDARIRRKLLNKLKDATVIIVAQRVATIMHADQIIVLKDGEIKGIGKHEELLKHNQVYREIVLSQISEEEAFGGVNNDA
ncbi:ABC transporter ATP-binding protein [Pseudothermotoga thermarum]|uniref:ABC transporter related protein n=1 Tax=Pseudothermotoga thermarum DSM 5069 TaxID=688269 RepID=F7YTE8_9THEM|nr:ABC transporter ATP-binding protein [Pseudothermotoga thermarum]AEH50126.1 ABC transporter related protein [Pseudothermotoga thermarum DSM 5069]